MTHRKENIHAFMRHILTTNGEDKPGRLMSYLTQHEAFMVAGKN